MTADEIKTRIHFKESKFDGDTIITGAIQFAGDFRISRHEIDRSPHVRDYAKERIREEIVRHIFEDQRKALHEACEELMRIAPHEYIEWHKAFSKLLAAAMYQEGATA